VLIGLGYKARTGKDEAARRLVERHGFIRLAFADALKAGCKAIFSLTDEQLHGDAKDEIDDFWGTTPRDILQRTGTECMRRGFGEGVWIKALERRLRGVRDAVVADVRFPNEAEAIKSWGGFLVRVDRPFAPRIGTSAHASETALDGYEGWDFGVKNNGTVDDLHRIVDELVEKIRRISRR